jgi:hypothetical protein
MLCRPTPPKTACLSASLRGAAAPAGSRSVTDVSLSETSCARITNSGALALSSGGSPSVCFVKSNVSKESHHEEKAIDVPPPLHPHAHAKGVCLCGRHMRVA